MKYYLFTLILLSVSYNVFSSGYEMGLLERTRHAKDVLEIQVISSKDSSTWITYPNGFNRRETHRIVTKCIVLKSSIANLKDTVSLIFELSDYCNYDSLGNLNYGIYPYLMHSTMEFNMQKGDIYSCLVRVTDEKISLLRADSISYEVMCKELFGAKKIVDYLEKRYPKEIYNHYNSKVFYFVQSPAIDTVVFYNPINKRFTLLVNDSFKESEEIGFDVSKRLFFDRVYFYQIIGLDKTYELSKDDLSNFVMPSRNRTTKGIPIVKKKKTFLS